MLTTLLDLILPNSTTYSPELDLLIDDIIAGKIKYQLDRNYIQLSNLLYIHVGEYNFYCEGYRASLWKAHKLRKFLAEVEHSIFIGKLAHVNRTAHNKSGTN